MVEPAADVPSRSKPHDDVRRELPVRPVILVRAFDELLHRRPEIIRKLGTLDHDPNVVPVTGKAVRRSYDEVLGDRRVENPAGSELLEHPLRDVEDAAFFFGGDVLPPEKRVLVPAELLLERLVDPLAQRQ